MSIYLGTPVDKRRADEKFAHFDVDYARVDRFDLLRIRIRSGVMEPTYSFAAYLIFFSWFLASGYTDKIFIAGVPMTWNLSAASPFLDPVIDLIIATTSAIASDMVLSLGLVEKEVPKSSRAKKTYLKRVRLSDVKEIFSLLDPSIILSGVGLSGKGLHLDSIRVLLNLQRLIDMYIHGQQSGSSSFGDIGPKSDYGTLVASVKLVAGIEEISMVGNEAQVPAKWEDTLNLELQADYTVVKLHAIDGTHDMKPDEQVEGKGHLIRFVSGTLPGDGEFISNLVYRLFANLLGNDASDVHSLCQLISSCIPLISRFDVGQATLFLLFVISLGYDSHGIVKLIRDKGDLLGAIILTDAPLRIRDRMVVSLTGPELFAVYSSWMTSEAAAGAIAEFLSLRDLGNGSGRTTITAIDISSYSKLLRQIRSRVRANPDPNTLSAIRVLRYSNFVPLAATTENIINCLKNIHAGVFPQNSTVTEHIFLGNTCIAANLAVFGTTSITFMNPNGKVVDLYSSAKDDPRTDSTSKITVQKLVTAKKGKRKYEDHEEVVPSWNRLCVSKVPLGKAISDFLLMQDRHVITQLTVYDSKSLGNVEIHPLSGSLPELLEALRPFGGTPEFFGSSKKVKLSNEPEVIGTGAKKSMDIHSFGL